MEVNETNSAPYTPLSFILQTAINRLSHQRNMAAIVPISCNQRWRSRSRNASTDSDFLGLMPASPSFVEGVAVGMLDEFAYEGDDEDQDVEMVESPHNLVMPREYTAQEAAWPIERLNTTKSMERRRASGF